MRTIFGISLALGLAASALAAAPVRAASFGPIASLGAEASHPVVKVQYLPRQPVRRKKRRNDAAIAGALLGAAIVGGAIIANSRRQRDYYDDGYYAPAPVYRRPRYVEQPYYEAPGQYRQPYYNDPGRYRRPAYNQPSYEQPRYDGPRYQRQPSYAQPVQPLNRRVLQDENGAYYNGTPGELERIRREAGQRQQDRGSAN